MGLTTFFDPRRLLGRSAVFQACQKCLSRHDSGDRLAREFLKIAPGQRVLDVGCGTASILAHLPPSIDYHGYDLSADYIAEAGRRYGERGSFNRAAVSLDAVAGLGKFDVVISIGVLHHLDDEEAAVVFASAAEILRPGGRVVTCDGAYVRPQNPIARLLLALDRGKYVRTPDAYLSLARPYFPDAQARIVCDLLAVPYTHCIIEAWKPAT